MDEEINDLNYYTWRERNGERLLVPCSDERVYEMDYGFVFKNVEDAVRAVVDMEMPYDPTTWELVHFRGEIVDTKHRPELRNLARDRELYEVYRQGGASAVGLYCAKHYPDWKIDYCPACEQHVAIMPEGCCSVCWEMI